MKISGLLITAENELLNDWLTCLPSVTSITVIGFFLVLRLKVSSSNAGVCQTELRLFPLSLHTGSLWWRNYRILPAKRCGILGCVLSGRDSTGKMKYFETKAELGIVEWGGQETDSISNWIGMRYFILIYLANSCILISTKSINIRKSYELATTSLKIIYYTLSPEYQVKVVIFHDVLDVIQQLCVDFDVTITCPENQMRRNQNCQTYMLRWFANNKSWQRTTVSNRTMDDNSLQCIKTCYKNLSVRDLNPGTLKR